MSYVIQAVLSNPRHPEYGQATIPFPIPNDDYDRIIGMMEELEIGDALKQDCQIDELDSHYSVLKRMELTTVNLDELDYLAKRLDSFCVGEDAQFQGMAAKMNLTDIKDFINLTFCYQRATVITDFSDLEAIGRSHYMNLHDGCASTEELNDLDGHETALLLIDGGGGVITPYGVVYDNGLKLGCEMSEPCRLRQGEGYGACADEEQLYDGRHFPCYHYDVNPITAGIVSCYASKETEPRDWIYLPASQSQIDRALVRAGIESSNEAVLCDFENTLPANIERALTLEYECIEVLNDMCAVIMPLDPKDRTKLEAVVAMAAPNSASQITQLAENLDQFDFVPGVYTPEEYGRYMIQESGHYEYDENLDGFYDYEKYGRQHIEQEQGEFTEQGYVAYNGTLSLEELMQEDPAEQFRKEQGFQMGGIS